jgi:hypothetical protein
VQYNSEMEKDVSEKKCHQPGCKILEGGSCLEGIDVNKDECPHFYLDVEKTNAAPKYETEIKPKKKKVVQLFTGKEMSFPETSVLTNNNNCRLIVIVGESESGKTTLLAEYFINFQKGPFCNYFFAGSFTQIGFEERCFKATIMSENKTPKTERTKSLEFGFLHLALKPENQLSEPAHQFLFSDISGERFRDAKMSTTLMKELTVLKAADFILFLLDGEKIADINNRALAIEEAKTFIQKALDENIIDTNTRLKIALAKWDFISEDSSFDFESRVVKPFTDRFAKRLKSLTFEKVAARSKTNKVPSSMGLKELLTEWDNEDLSIPVVQEERPIISQRKFQCFTFPQK